MRKPISPRIHGAIDYATVAAVAAAPRALDFPEEAETLCYALAGGYLGLSMFTDYPLAVRHAIPFKGHGIAEAAIGLLLPALPWVLGFARHEAARNTFIGLSALTAVVASLTDWNARDRGGRKRRRRPRARSAIRRPRLAA